MSEARRHSECETQHGRSADLRRAAFALGAMLLALAATPDDARAAPQASCVATCAEKSPGVCAAPAYVHVDCTATTDSSSGVRPFHDLRYVIRYGDTGPSGAGNWRFSGMPKSQDISPIGAHVYESAGTFTIRSDVSDSAGVTSTTSDTVTVISEDAAWPAAATRCVSATGNFTDCPSGVTNRVQATDYDGALQTAAGRRTLFRCGETFTASSNPQLADATNNGGLIGGYGSCAGNPARVEWSFDGGLHSGGSGIVIAGWRFRDLSYTNTGTTAERAGAVGLIGGTLPNNKFLFLRVKSAGVSTCGGAAGMLATIDLWNDLGVAAEYECVLTRWVDSGSWPMGLFSGRRSAILGSKYSNEMNNPSATTNGFRAMSYEKSLFAHNQFRSSSNSGSLTVHFRVCAPACATRNDNRNVLLHNHFHDNSPEEFRTISLQNASGDASRKTDYIVEGNRFTYGSTQARDRGPMAIQVSGVRRASIRNNIFDYRGLPNVTNNAISAIAVGSEGTATAEEVFVYNNTVISDQTTTAMGVTSLSSGEGHRGRNNLVYDLGSAAPTEACTGSICSQNLVLQASSDGCPFRGSDNACRLTAPSEFTDFSEFQIRSSGGSRARVVDQGFVLPDSPVRAMVFFDNFQGCRSTATGGPDARPDIGASEAGATRCELAPGQEPPAALEPPTLLTPR